MKIFLSLIVVIRIIIFGMFSSTYLNTLSSSLLLSCNINFGLQIIGLYTVVYRCRHMYVSSMEWPYYENWWIGRRQKIIWKWAREKVININEKSIMWNLVICCLHWSDWCVCVFVCVFVNEYVINIHRYRVKGPVTGLEWTRGFQ